MRIAPFAFVVVCLFGVVAAKSFPGSTHEYEESHMHPTIKFKNNQPHTRLHKRDMPMIYFGLPEETETSITYWKSIGQNILRNQLQKDKLNTNVAKKVILFMGDGMSIPTISAGRVYMGGEEKELSFEKFPFVGLSKTYCANTQVADSACAATAYLSGVKSNYATIGVSAAVDLNDCKGQNKTENHVPSIAKWAQENGMATGLITTTSVTHASPAGVYAYTSNRNWEDDSDMRADGVKDLEQCKDIATQMLYNDVGHNLNVVMGGGRRHFLPNWEKDLNGESGRRTDGRNLLKEWKKRHGSKGVKSEIVHTKEELMKLSADTDYMLGLFAPSYMPFHLEADNTTTPTLAEMVSKALDILEKQNKGYFLFVEGGLIDTAHHYTEAIKAIDETLEFHKAVEVAKQRTSEEDTLIVVTSDHSHTMSMSGYSSRRNDIFGVNDQQTGNDLLPYATLSYANGPGFEKNVLEGQGKRRNLNEINMHDKDYRFPSTVPLDSETHGGDDVAVFASGPYAHLFSGVYEQNYIPHAMAYAACIGNGLTACNEKSR